MLGELKSRRREDVFTALNYSPDLNNTANREFASAYRKPVQRDPDHVRGRLVRRRPGARQGGPHRRRRARRRRAVNLALGKIGQVDSPRGEWQFNQPRTPQQKWYLRRVQRDGPVLSNVLINELATLG